MRTPIRVRATTLTAAAMVAVGLTAGPAHAVVPSNDTIENATPISAVPYAVEQNISDATKTAGDPRPSCDRGTRGNVWWTVTPTSSGWIVADTGGSRIATVLAVYTGSPGALTEVACNDDSYQDNRYSEQARAYWNATAGTTYYLMVAKDYGGGGALTLTVDNSAAPFTVDAFAIDPVGSVDNQTGVARLHGTVTCSQGPGPVFIALGVVQQIGRVYIRDRAYVRVTCDGTTPWEMKFASSGGLFTAGSMDVKGSFAWRDGNGGYQKIPVTTVRLRP